MNNLFATGETIKFDGKYNSKIEKAVQSFDQTFEISARQIFNEGNNTKKIFLPAYHNDCYVRF